MTHALLGAVTARAVVPARLTTARLDVGLAGAFGALLPDMDRLIFSAADPLLHIEYHRHFTHALAFVPIGGAAAALPWMLSSRARAQPATCAIAATAGYATHGLLDASTTYGTLLLWPFSHVRIAWNWISIIDPVFTAILLLGALLTWRASREYTLHGPEGTGGAPQVRPGASLRRVAIVTLLLALAYVGAGGWQRDRAAEAQRRVAASRGHVPARAEVFPGFANNVIWRSLYEYEGVLYLDRLRVPWMGAPAWSAGTSVPKVDRSTLEAVVDPRLRREFDRFAWFSGGWVACSETDPGFLGDARYSLSAERFDPVWGIRLRPGSDPPVEWVDRSPTRRIDPGVLWSEIRGTDPSYHRLPLD